MNAHDSISLSLAERARMRTEGGLYARRAVGRDCDHRHPGGALACRRFKRPAKRPAVRSARTTCTDRGRLPQPREHAQGISLRRLELRPGWVIRTRASVRSNRAAGFTPRRRTLEEQAVFNLGAGTWLGTQKRSSFGKQMEAVIPVFNCPSRRHRYGSAGAQLPTA